MVNPVFTILFDLFLIGTAVAVSATMVAEYLGSREPHVGTTRRNRAMRAQPASGTKRSMSRASSPRRRAA